VPFLNCRRETNRKKIQRGGDNFGPIKDMMLEIFILPRKQLLMQRFLQLESLADTVFFVWSKHFFLVVIQKLFSDPEKNRTIHGRRSARNS